MEQNISTNFKTESQKSAPAPTIREVKGVPRPRAQGFMLEVLKQVEHVHPEGWHYNKPEYLHVGYMQKIFKRKSDAVHYYDIHNKHMRSLNAHRTYRSDCDPDTGFICIVRDYKGCEALKIPSMFFIMAD